MAKLIVYYEPPDRERRIDGNTDIARCIRLCFAVRARESTEPAERDSNYLKHAMIEDYRLSSSSSI